MLEGRRVTLQARDARPQNLQLPPRMPRLSVLIKHQSCLQFSLRSPTEEASFPSVRIHLCQSQESPRCLSNIPLLLKMDTDRHLDTGAETGLAMSPALQEGLTVMATLWSPPRVPPLKIHPPAEGSEV